MPTLYSTVNETGNRNRILERCKIRFCLVHWIDPRSIEHNYACLSKSPLNFMKMSFSAFSGRRRVRCSVMTPPAVLNNRSEGTLDGGAPRYVRATDAISGNLTLLSLHHANMSLVRDKSGSAM